jgi:cytochrome c553
MKRAFILAAALFQLVTIWVSGPALAAPVSTAALATRCQSCHGDQAGSRPDAARLNGLSSDYLFKRLQAFSNPIDQSPHAIDNMWSIIVNMSDIDKRELADYFSSQPVPAVKLNGPALGKALREWPSC